MGDLFWGQTHFQDQNVVYLVISKQRGGVALVFQRGQTFDTYFDLTRKENCKWKHNGYFLENVSCGKGQIWMGTCTDEDEELLLCNRCQCQPREGNGNCRKTWIFQQKSS